MIGSFNLLFYDAKARTRNNRSQNAMSFHALCNTNRSTDFFYTSFTRHESVRPCKNKSQNASTL